MESSNRNFIRENDDFKQVQLPEDFQINIFLPASNRMIHLLKIDRIRNKISACKAQLILLFI